MVRWHPNGHYLATGSDKQLRFWDLRSGACVRVLDGHTAAVSCLPWVVCMSAADHALQRKMPCFPSLRLASACKLCVYVPSCMLQPNAGCGRAAA